MEIKVSWSDIKQFTDDRSLSIQFVEFTGSYILIAIDGNLTLSHKMAKSSPASSDQTDFETNYKSNGNNSLDQLDSDGAHLSRVKTTKTGWHYEPRSLDFYSSKLNSLYNRKHDGAGIDDGADYGDASLKFYNASNTELVQGGSETDIVFQTRLDAGCVKTTLDWQSTYDFDIIGGSLQLKNEPTDRAYLWCVIAPDIAENLGGSVPYFAGGINLQFFKAGSSMSFDGRGIKSFQYDPVYNSNKVRFIIKHKLGEQLGLQIMIDQFKA